MRRLRQIVAGRLKGIFPESDVKILTKALCLSLPGVREQDYYLMPELPADESRDSLLLSWTGRIASGEPLQYVLGYTDFCGCRFKCDSRALIPRPETTELVEWLLSGQASEGSLLDIGTGTGCIAVSFARSMPGWKVSALDISADALSLARENCLLNGVSVTLLEQDILSPADDDAVYDCIVSNPPYIARSESAEMERNVLDYEPHTALFVPDSDPLLFYRAIAAYARTHLHRDGSLYLEINPLFADSLERLLDGEGFSVTFRDDISGRRRMAKAIYQ